MQNIDYLFPAAVPQSNSKKSSACLGGEYVNNPVDNLCTILISDPDSACLGGEYHASLFFI